MNAEPAATRETELAVPLATTPRLHPASQAAGAQVDATLAPGRTLGNYRILSRIGRGAMGGVYLAEHALLQRRVALKVLNARWINDPEAVLRFEREAVAAAKLDHPHIVRVHDAQRQNGLAFLVMEYVPGEDLAQHVRKHGPLPWRIAVDCVRQVAEALAYAHSSGIVHRDIKPQNLLYTATGPSQPETAGTIKVLDLGLAKLAESPAGDSARITQDDSFIGTVGYMAPEQILNPHHADARSDVYSLGCTLYVLVTGEPVFAGTTPERLRAHLSAPVPSLRLRRHLGTSSFDLEALDQIDVLLQKMLTKDPAARIPSMEAVVRQLAHIASPATAQASTPAMVFLDAQPAKKRRDQRRPFEWLKPALRVASSAWEWCARMATGVRPALNVPSIDLPLESSVSRLTETLLLPHALSQ